MGKNGLYIITMALVLLLMPVAMYSQIQIKLMPGFNEGGYVPQRVCLELNNNGPPVQSLIKITIKDAATDSVAATMHSNEFLLTPGVKQILPGLIEQFKLEELNDTYFTGYLQLKKGQYLAYVDILPSKEDVSIATAIFTFNVTIETAAKQKNKVISSSGNAQITGVYATRQQTFSNMPKAYLQATLNPSITLFGIPVSANANLSTLQTSTLQNSNTFTINYNSNALKAVLQNKLTEQLKKNEEYNKLSTVKESIEINKYTGYKKILENPAVQKELAEIAKLDSLKNIADTLGYLKNLRNGLPDSLTTNLYSADSLQLIKDSLDKVIAKVEKIEKKYNALKAKKEAYDKIIKDKDELEAKLKNEGSIDSLGRETNKLKAKVKDVYNTVKNPGDFKQQLKENQLLRGIDKVLLSVNKINIGTSYPFISTLTLNGVRVNGINIELCPKGIFASVTYGTIQDPVLSYDITNASYKRKLWSSTIGWGETEGPHLHFTVLNAYDDSSSISPRDSIFVSQKLPQNNYVLSTDFRLPIFKNLTITGELAGSQTTRDIALLNPDSSSYTTTAPNNYTANNWLGNILLQKRGNSNVVTGYAFNSSVELTLFKGKTKISGGVKKVGLNYRTFGMPFLPTDLLTIESKISQKIWKNRILLSLTVKRNIDNLSGAKLSTTTNYQYAGDIKVAIPKWPTLRVSYLPVQQQNDTLSILLTILNVNSSYQYKIGRVKNIITANYIRQKSVSSNSALNFFSENALLSNTSLVSRNLSISISANYINFRSNELPSTKTINLTASATFGLFKQKLSNTVGATYIKNQMETRYGFLYNASIALNKYVSVNLRLENNQYNTIVINPILSAPNFSEFMGQLSIAAKW